MIVVFLKQDKGTGNSLPKNVTHVTPHGRLLLAG